MLFKILVITKLEVYLDIFVPPLVAFIARIVNKTATVSRLWPNILALSSFICLVSFWLTVRYRFIIL